MTDEMSEAQFGPHRFEAGQGLGSTQFLGAHFDVADMRGATFLDCDLSGARIADSFLADVTISGFISNLVINDVDVTGFIEAELDRRHPERVQLRAVQTADDFRSMGDTVDRLWAEAVARADQLPEAARHEQVDGEWSFTQTLRHLIWITDSWASRTILDEPMPYHRLGLPQSWYPPAQAAALGIDLAADPGYDEVLAVRAGRQEVIRRILADLSDAGLGRPCRQPPAPLYPEEPETVGECLGVVMEEEIEHYRFAVRDLAVLETRAR
jgi:DinB superfamily